jgi:hypothetical protein
MTVFTVSTGLIKKSNQLLIDSNKLNSVFYNIGNKFVLTNPDDLAIAKLVLNRNYISLKVA